LQQSPVPKQDARRLALAAQEDLRGRVMSAVNGGMGVNVAACTFGVTRQSTHNWRHAVDQVGAPALRARKRGPKSGARSLAPPQRAAIVRSNTAGCPDRLRLRFSLWTRDAVIDLAQRRFGVVVSRSTMGRYLRERGMSPQKPVRLAFERDPAAVRRWLEEEYPAIVAKVKRAKAEIHWADEMGLRSDHQTGTSWSKRGVTPAVPETGRRFGCNMISAVTKRGSLVFMVFTERLTAAVMLRFLRRLVRQAGRKVFLGVDGNPVHRSSQVRRWVADNERSLEMFHLPPCSPDLNPDELLNNDVKGHAVGRRRPTDRSEMIAGVRAYLRSTQRQPHVVQRYVQAESELDSSATASPMSATSLAARRWTATPTACRTNATSRRGRASTAMATASPTTARSARLWRLSLSWTRRARWTTRPPRSARAFLRSAPPSPPQDWMSRPRCSPSATFRGVRTRA